MSTYTSKHREYYLKNRESILDKRREAEREWIVTPKGIYSVQKRKAKQRGIEWLFTFDEWWELWQASGKWEQRGPQGYVMCREGDTGPYSSANCRIDTCQNNAKENYSKLGIDKRGRFNAASV